MAHLSTTDNRTAQSSTTYQPVCMDTAPVTNKTEIFSAFYGGVDRMQTRSFLF